MLLYMADNGQSDAEGPVETDQGRYICIAFSLN